MELFYSPDRDGNLITLDPEESGHCVRVLRHRAGDSISVIDGRGNLHRCELLLADQRAAEARIVETVEGFGAHPYHLTMAVCPTKNIDRFEWFAEKATEIGVDVIAPVFGEHSERRNLKTDRLRRITLSAVKQSLKGAVPEIPEPVSVKQFIADAPADALKLICYCDETLERDRRLSVKQALCGSDNRKICILIGPEGDFSPSEVEAAFSAGWIPVHLGESRLRTETAALTAVTATYLLFE